MGVCIPKKARKSVKIISNIKNKNSPSENIKDTSFIATNIITNDNTPHSPNQIDIRKKINESIKSTLFNNYIKNINYKNKKFNSLNFINLSNLNNYTNNVKVKSNKFYVNTYSTNNTENNETENNLNRNNKTDNNIINADNIVGLNHQITFKNQSTVQKRPKGPILSKLEEHSKKLKLNKNIKQKNY